MQTFVVDSNGSCDLMEPEAPWWDDWYLDADSDSDFYPDHHEEPEPPMSVQEERFITLGDIPVYAGLKGVTFNGFSISTIDDFTPDGTLIRSNFPDKPLPNPSLFSVNSVNWRAD